MKKLLIFFMGMILMSGTANATVGWNKSIPATGENPQAISPDVIENNTAIDLMLQDYRSGHVSISLISTSEIDVGPGGVMLSNAGGSVRLMVANAALTAVSSTMIDTGTISASSTYYLYAYASSTTATTFSVIFSASATSPTGITYYALLGSFTTDSSKNFISASSNINTQIGLGSWVSKSSGTIYQAATDGFVMASGNTSSTNGSGIEIISDSSSSPSTVRVISQFPGGDNLNGSPVSITCPVRKNDYYEIVSLNSASVNYSFFISLGS